MSFNVDEKSCSSGSTVSFRIATTDDLDDIARVAQTGFPDDPEWNYRFPYRALYPEDNWKWTRCDYRFFLNQPEKYTVLVATLPIENSRIIALAVWNIAVTSPDRCEDYDSGIDQRRDVNKAHFECFAESLDAALDKYFARYQDRQYHLWLLATHPSYRRRGAGTVLARWGVDKAQSKGWPATVLASPMGKLLYEHVGFREVGTVTVQVQGEDEKLLISCLTCQPAGSSE